MDARAITGERDTPAPAGSTAWIGIPKETGAWKRTSPATAAPQNFWPFHITKGVLFPAATHRASNSEVCTFPPSFPLWSLFPVAIAARSALFTCPCLPRGSP